MPREGKLTASQFAAAAGISPYTSRAEAWRLITGRKTFEGNAATEHGNDCEGMAVAAYEAHTGEIVTDRQKWFEEDHYGTHIDGNAGGLITEFKCPVAGMYDDVPLHYMPQVQGQMRLAGSGQCHFVAWTHDELRIWLVESDGKYWEWLRPLLEQFWSYVQTDAEPPRLSRKPKPFEVKTQRIA
jgi:predicted phage-related endonuclease